MRPVGLRQAGEITAITAKALREAGIGMFAARVLPGNIDVEGRGNLLETWDRFFQYLRTEISMAAAALRVRRLISSAVKLLKFCEE